MPPVAKQQPQGLFCGIISLSGLGDIAVHLHMHPKTLTQPGADAGVGTYRPEEAMQPLTATVACN